MQDNQTGNFIEIPDASQQSRDAALSRDRQGAVFCVGEELEIRGGRFAVQSIGRNMIVFRSLPGTDLRAA